MRKLLAGLLAAGLIATSAGSVLAGSPHFIGNAWDIDVSGDTITVSGKEAGLGDEEQVHVVLAATAECWNRGGNHPRAANKDTFNAEGDFPVQNGKATFSLTVTAVFQPDCSPPMTVVWTSVTVTDTTNGISVGFSL